MIRKATEADIPAVAAIYDRIHTEEERGLGETGWVRGIYPTEDTAREALAAGELYVLEEEGRVFAAARINQAEVPEYALARWQHPARPEEILVLHTLVVDPREQGRGLGRRFVAFYEALGRELGAPELRMDTNVRNAFARRLYARLGYREVGTVPCVFNGIPGVKLVCLEKRLEDES